MPRRAAWGLIVIAFVISESQAGEWTGPDVLNANFSNWSVSGTSSIYQSQVSGGNLRMGLLPRPYWVINQSLDRTMTASRSVSVTPGKRYRYEVRGREQRSVVAGSVNVEWWADISGGPSSSHYSSTSYQSTSMLHVPGGSSMTVRTRARVTASPVAELYHDYAEYDWATLRQVVYDPQLNIAEDSVRINSDAPGGSTAEVSLGLHSLSFADDPTAWDIDWGDGSIEPDPTLNASHAHEYTIPSGTSAVWTASFSGNNEAGSDSDTATIKLLSQPDIALSVNGSPVLDGGVVEIDIVNNSILDLSLLDSLGFIETTSFFVPDRLDWIGTDLTLMTSIFDESDIGELFPLTATISNTGLGINADALTINLSIVPEPSTAVLLSMASLVVLYRRQQ
jgi:hypothetical protein